MTSYIFYLSSWCSFNKTFKMTDKYEIKQLVPITTKVMSLSPNHGEVYSIQHYMINFVSARDLRQVRGFLRVLRFPPSDRHHITEILLKVALNTITLTPLK
jgi:hypothetical protein